MGFFTTAQREIAEGRSVFYGELFVAGFLSGTRHYWDGFGDLSAYAQTWEGAANVVSRSEIPIGVDDEAGQLTLMMSGVDAAVMAAVRAEEAEVAGRPLTLFGQLFDESLALAGDRFFLFRGTMDVPTYTAAGPGQRSVTIPVEGEWTDRNGAKFSYFSDRDQQARFPGDRGCEFVYRYHAGVRRTWPEFDS